ncbi:phage baseplate assembly protein V [Pandoraea captiosa]|uniref:Phage baseplate assembly protein V n=2 Tax=Pandoraea captiosa TaxID=2508302 RepID=A0A5E4ZH48_9BURK|nr:phage baseplate assembly protein V [Pandoraea captiosa]
MDPRTIKAMVARAMNTVRLAFRSVIGATDSGGSVQLVSGEALAGENLPDAEYFQHYGLTSNPPAGTMAIVVPLGGATSHSVIVATEHGSYRLKELKPGEVALYTDEGDSFVFMRGRVTHLKTRVFTVDAEEAVNFNTPNVNISHQLNVTQAITGMGGMQVSGGDGVSVEGKMTVSEDVIAGGVSTGHHKHPGDSGGTTGEPIAS